MCSVLWKQIQAHTLVHRNLKYTIQNSTQPEAFLHDLTAITYRSADLVGLFTISPSGDK